MAYIVQPGREVHDGMVYKAGDAYPAMKGGCPALVADGAVAWVTPEKSEPEKKPAAKVTRTRKAAKP